MTRIVARLTDLLSGKSCRGMGIADNGTEVSRAASVIDSIGNDWRCWRLRGETDRNFAFRLALHLECVGLTVETDLARVLEAEKQARGDIDAEDTKSGKL